MTPPAKVTVTTDRQEITLQPGGQVELEARIERREGFAGRVPIDVRNLPFGVRVMDVGLNGVLVTEKETARKFVLYCEPWVLPQTRSLYVMALPEGQEANAALPVTLRIDFRSSETRRAALR